MSTSDPDYSKFSLETPFLAFIPAFVVVFLFCAPLAITLWLQNTSFRSRALRELRREGVSCSNMGDQSDTKYDIPADTTTDSPIRIKAIFIHPIKSCAPVELSRALLLKSGLSWDRCFALAMKVDRPEAEGGPIWRFISQRTKPLMSQIQTEIWLPHEGSDPEDPLVRSTGCLVFRFPSPSPLSLLDRIRLVLSSRGKEVSAIVPLFPSPEFQEEYGLGIKPFAIHSREAKGLDMGTIPAVAAVLPTLKRFLNIPEHQDLTLLRCTPETLVRTDKNLAPLEHIGKPAVHGYTDQQPVNINNLASVHAVSALLPKENRPLNALRFRANIWITGAAAFDEETWKRCRISPMEKDAKRVPPTLSVVCRTSRCTMPNVNPTSGKFDTDAPGSDKKRGRAQPSTTLVQHRTVEDGNPKALGYIGMHCVPEDASLPEATDSPKGLYIRVGDEIEVLERGLNLYGSTGNDY